MTANEAKLRHTLILIVLNILKQIVIIQITSKLKIKTTQETINLLFFKDVLEKQRRPIIFLIFPKVEKSISFQIRILRDFHWKL